MALRASAIVESEDYVLLCRGVGNDWWYLPGGRVKTGESSPDAVRRELGEELACPFTVSRAMAFGENFFHLRRIDYHEIGTFYAARLDAPRSAVAPPRDGDEIRRWVAKEDVPSLDVRPTFVHELIANPRGQFRLIVHRDGVESLDVPTARP